MVSIGRVQKGDEKDFARECTLLVGNFTGGEEGGPEGLEFPGDDFLNGGEVEVVAEFGVEGGDGAFGSRDAARDDASEVGEVGVYVEGEAMVSDPTPDGDPEGGDFARADPDAGEAGASRGGEAEGADGVDQNLLEEAKVGVQVFAGGEGDDGVADELAGTVVGDVSAAVGRGEFDTLGGEPGGVPDQVFLGAGAEADGEHGLVFGEDQRVTDLAGQVAGDEGFLRDTGGFVARAPPVDHGDRDGTGPGGRNGEGDEAVIAASSGIFSGGATPGVTAARGSGSSGRMIMTVQQLHVENVKRSAAALTTVLAGRAPKLAIVLGSGLGGLADRVEGAVTVPHAELPGFPVLTVQGHTGALVAGKLNGVDVVVLKGRKHFYETDDPYPLKTMVRTLRAVGVEVLFLSNAAGSLRAPIGVSQLMLITDHINALGLNPLTGANDETFGPRFFGMSDAWDPALSEKISQAAVAELIPLHREVTSRCAGRRLRPRRRSE